MPTNCDETVHERYAREHQELLEMYAKMTPEEEEILTIAYEALMIPPRDIHELANIIESNENFA